MKIDSPTFLTETTFISSSVVFSSGSQKFGNTDDDTHIFIGDISGSAKTTGSFGKLTIGGPVFHDVSASKHSVLTIHSPTKTGGGLYFATGSAITIVGDSTSGRQRINWAMDGNYDHAEGDDKVYSYIEARGQGGGDNRGELYLDHIY